MADVLNPVDVENAIREAVNTVAEGVKVLSERLTLYRQAEREFDLAVAHAYLKADGTIPERKYATEIATAELRRRMDETEVAYKYAERRCKAAELTLSAYQTLSKSVNQMYSAAGTGEY